MTNAPPVQNPIVGMPCSFPFNPNPMHKIEAALLADLKGWLVRGTEPPPSVYPKLADGTLVKANTREMRFPTITGMPLPDGIASPLLVDDLGSDFK